MSDQDTDERTDQAADEEPDREAHERAEQDSPDEGSDNVSTSGVELEGYQSNNNPREEREAITQADSPDDVDDDLIQEIEEERKRRLDPDNRPDNVEVDNTQRTFITEEARFEDSEIDQDPDLGQGDTGEGDSSDDDADDDGGASGEHSGTRDEHDAGQGPGEPEAAPDPGRAASAGKHKA